MGKGITAEIKQLFIPLEIKSANEVTGIFDGYLAVFRVIDGQKDAIIPGAFVKTLKDAYQSKQTREASYLYPILWQHNPYEPIGGFLEMHEDEFGLAVQGQLDMDTELGRRAYSGLKKGYLGGLSIGYRTIKDEMRKDGVRLLRELALIEGSVVTFPANDLARVLPVNMKSEGEAVVMETKGASGKTTWPLAPRERAWDNGAAHRRIIEWATNGDGSLDTGKMKSVHFWYDSADAQNIGAYKLLFCDAIGGEIQACPRAIFACAGQHGILTAKIDDMDAVKARIETYYNRMRREFNDDSIVAPWIGKARDFNTLLSDETPDGLLYELDEMLDSLKEAIIEILIDGTISGKQTVAAVSTGQFVSKLLTWFGKADGVIIQPPPDGAYKTMIVPDETMQAELENEEKYGAAISGAHHVMLSNEVGSIETSCNNLRRLLARTQPRRGKSTDEHIEDKGQEPSVITDTQALTSGEVASDDKNETDFFARLRQEIQEYSKTKRV